MNESRIETMLSQLIKMVGSVQADQQDMRIEIKDIRSEQQEMKQDIQNMQVELKDIRSEQHEMKQDIQNMQIELKDIKIDQQDIKSTQNEMQHTVQELKTKEEEHHREILSRFKDLEMDQDFIWEKAARNEREIEHIKRKLG